MLMLAGFYTLCMVMFWLPGAWLFLVPACLPWLNFSPWTGWVVFEEFDVLLLAVLAAGYGRWAFSPAQARPALQWRSSATVLPALLAAAGMLALLRGGWDAGGWTWGWFQGYADPLNSVRVAKSLLWALLCLPLLREAVARAPAAAGRSLAWGMLTGLVLVTLAVLSERAAFPNLFNFTSKYRTTAWFWEMHVGGAAIDAYLALSTPFVVWALRSARRPWQWGFGAILALAVAYAGLTTFARGVYLSMAAPVLLLGVWFWLQRAGLDLRTWLDALRQRRLPGWRMPAACLLALALLAEIVGVLQGGSFMAERLAHTERDFGSRLEHWQRGLDLRDDPVDQWLGIGLGRLPSHYAHNYPEGEWPGHVTLHAEPGVQRPFMRLHGPDTDPDLDAYFSLTQRVRLEPTESYRAKLQVRVDAPVEVYLQLCERHLLYPGRCQDAFLQLAPTESPWQQIDVPLHGPQFKRMPWYAPRLGMLSVSVFGGGTHADFQSIGLAGRNGKELLANGDFAQGLARWFPAERIYFLPWHIDNLYLELLIERGVLGLLLWLLLVGWALWHLLLGRARHQPLAPYLAASLIGVSLVGLVSSVMDVPRVAFLPYLLAFVALCMARNTDPPKA